MAKKPKSKKTEESAINVAEPVLDYVPARKRRKKEEAWF